MTKKFTFIDNYLIIDYYEKFLDDEVANQLLNTLKKNEFAK